MAPNPKSTEKMCNWGLSAGVLCVDEREATKHWQCLRAVSLQNLVVRVPTAKDHQLPAEVSSPAFLPQLPPAKHNLLGCSLTNRIVSESPMPPLHSLSNV